MEHTQTRRERERKRHPLLEMWFSNLIPLKMLKLLQLSISQAWTKNNTFFTIWKSKIRKKEIILRLWSREILMSAKSALFRREEKKLTLYLLCVSKSSKISSAPHAWQYYKKKKNASCSLAILFNTLTTKLMYCNFIGV